jgi:WD40 repeat protein
VALSADGKLLAAVGSSSAPMLFRLGVDRLPHPQLVGYLAQDPGGHRLATGSNDPRIRIWDTRTSTLAGTLEVAADDGPLGLAYARDRSLAAVFGDGRVLVFAPDGRLRSTLRVDAGMVPNSPAFSPDGSLLAVVVEPEASAAGTGDPVKLQAKAGVADVVVWDIRTGRRRAQLETPEHFAISVVFGKDGGHLLAASNHSRPVDQASGPGQDGGLWLWRTADLALLAHRTLPGAALDDVESSPDGGTVAVASTAGHAELVHAGDLTPAGTIGAHDFEVDRVAWSPDGRMLATATNSDADSVRMWDVRTNTLVAEFRMHRNAVEDLAFSPDGRTLATASGDWTVAIHHLDPAEAVRRICAIVVPSAEAHQTRIPRLCR